MGVGTANTAVVALGQQGTTAGRLNLSLVTLGVSCTPPGTLCGLSQQDVTSFRTQALLTRCLTSSTAHMCPAMGSCRLLSSVTMPPTAMATTAGLDS